MRKIAVFVIVLCTALFLVACEPEWPQEDEFKALSGELYIYALSLWLHNHSGLWRSDSMFRNNGYTNIAFVFSEEEFLESDFPEYILVAWPSLYTYLMRDGINRFIRENEAQGNSWLTYPVTMEDMFDNWESIHRFMREGVTSTATRSNLIAPLVREEYSRIINAELEKLNSAIEASDIDVSLYGFELPITWRISFLNFSANLILVFEVYAQLDEDVRKQLEIPNLYARFRDTRRMLDWDDENFGDTTTPRDQAFGFPENYKGRIRAWEFW